MQPGDMSLQETGATRQEVVSTKSLEAAAQSPKASQGWVGNMGGKAGSGINV